MHGTRLFQILHEEKLVHIFVNPSSFEQCSYLCKVFVYVCPTSSPIKNRMLYSTGAGSVQRSATSLLAESSSTLASRKLETSDPSEVNEEFLVSGLDLRESPAASNPIVGVVHSGKLGGGETRPAFARPKRPGSKR